ncbi:unnamed protein product [Fusarium fujikuroi]|nr:unnamed protein product [Fusarium fujikuroi]
MFDSDEYQPSDMDTDPTNNSDMEIDSDLEDTRPPSVFDTNKHQLSDIETDLTSQSGAKSESESYICNLSPDYFLQIEDESDDDDADQTAFSAATLKQLDGIERRWNAYCNFTNRNPRDCLHNLDYQKTKGFFTWICIQKTGVGGRRLRGLKSASSLKQYWKFFREVFWRETKKRVDDVLKRKMSNFLYKLTQKHGLTAQRRENRCMTIENLEKQAKTTISTTKKRFRIGEHRIYALLFLLLIAPSGSRPQALLLLRYGDLELSLARDPEGGPHRILIRFKLCFTKTFLGEKEILRYSNTLTLPETIFDSSLLLSPHTLLLGLIFRHKAFEAPTLTSPEHLSKLDIHPDEDELPLPLKKCMDETFVFRDTDKTAVKGFILSSNKQITYGMISKWTKDIGVFAGFMFTVILYTLRYNSANEFDNSPNISDGLRNLLLQHANSNTFRKHYLGRVVSVDTMAVVRRTKQQNALMRQACSIGYSASTRRPTHLTAEQSAAVDGDPEIQKLVHQRQELRKVAKGSPKAREKIESITKALQSLRVKLRRELKQQYRQGWSRKQAVVDIERQLAGQTFEESPSPSDESSYSAQEQHPAQKRLFEALTAPVADTLEGEHQRRNNAVLAVMAYCPVQESPVPRTRNQAMVTKNRSPLRLNTAGKEPQPMNDIGTAIASVFVTNRDERSRRCFLCIGTATTLQPSDPAIERLINPFYSPGDLSKHFKRRHLSNLQPNERLHCRLCDETLDHKMHLQNHAETVHGTVSQGG